MDQVSATSPRPTGPELPKTPPNRRRRWRRRRVSDEHAGPVWEYPCKWIKHPNRQVVAQEHKNCYLQLPYEFARQEGLLAGPPSPMGDPPLFKYPALLERHPDADRFGHPHCWIVKLGDVHPPHWEKGVVERPLPQVVPLPQPREGGEKVLGAPIWENASSAISERVLGREGGNQRGAGCDRVLIG
ncbi:hypothetical protein B7463_g4116, partial [Scytalidium lignicola]